MTGLSVLHGDLFEGGILKKAASVCMGAQLENATWRYECHTRDLRGGTVTLITVASCTFQTCGR